MGKRVYKKYISIFLVVCMLVSITPASTCQVKAAGGINIMDITEKAGVFVRGGMKCLRTGESRRMELWAGNVGNSKMHWKRDVRIKRKQFSRFYSHCK